MILLGPPGVGKTHLAVALAEAAIRAGQAAYFMTAHELVDDLGRAYREGRLDRRMKVYLAPKVLIIDEMGYLPLDEMGATIFFQLVSARYERGSIILTSNKSYGDWGSVFGDPIIATAILDRLLHHSTTINIRGESWAEGPAASRTVDLSGPGGAGRAGFRGAGTRIFARPGSQSPAFAVNASSGDGTTPLMLAATCGDATLVKALLSHRPDVNAADAQGLTALELATAAGCTEVVRLLKKAGVREKTRQAGQTGAGQLPPAPPANSRSELDRPDAEGLTPLMRAVLEPRTDRVKQLLSRGADPNAQGPDGRTALMYAAWYGSTDALKLLFARRVDPNATATDKAGYTALRFAEMQHHALIAYLLKKAGARVTAPPVPLQKPRTQRARLPL